MANRSEIGQLMLLTIAMLDSEPLGSIALP